MFLHEEIEIWAVSFASGGHISVIYKEWAMPCKSDWWKYCNMSQLFFKTYEIFDYFRISLQSFELLLLFP